MRSPCRVDPEGRDTFSSVLFCTKCHLKSLLKKTSWSKMAFLKISRMLKARGKLIRLILPMVNTLFLHLCKVKPQK